ncbi:UNVERIFIED_CONTAM: hypothetical protein Sindi_0818500 [Sesamum indicum]
MVGNWTKFGGGKGKGKGKGKGRTVKGGFSKAWEAHSPQSTTKDHNAPAESEASVAMMKQQMWLATVEGKNKDRVFSLGSKAHISSRTFTSPLPHPTTPLLPNSAMMRDMWASSSTTTSPSIDSPASNQNDMNIADDEGLD